MLSTPNYVCTDTFGDRWIGLTSSFEHLYFYSADVLKRLAFRSGFVLQHWETSFPDGAMLEQRNFFLRQMKSMNTATELLKEYGIRKSVSIKMNKIPRYVTHGKGHTLFTVFKKA